MTDTKWVTHFIYCNGALSSGYREIGNRIEHLSEEEVEMFRQILENK